jgi:signal transduction histidine kinase
METTPDRQPPPVGGELRLPRAPGMVRQFWSRHPWWMDSLVAVLYLVPSLLVTVVLAASPERADGMPGLIGVVSVTVAAAALLFRRHRPRLVLVVTWATMFGSVLAWSSGDSIATALAIYAVAVYRSAREAWIAFGASALLGVGASLLGAQLGAALTPATPNFVAGSIFTTFTMLVAVLIGINIGNRRRYVLALVDRAEQLVRERDQQARLSAAAERSRIAREMHDIVSHGLTVMVTLAEGSAASTTANPERAAAAMRQVAETGRMALTDMRRMLGVLHDGAPDTQTTDGHALEPQPGVADLARLVEGFRAAGLPVAFASSGVPPANQAEQLTVYRLVQEALTNVLRHASNTRRVRVRVAYSPTGVAIAVVDDSAPTAAPETTAGNGLVGMRERVALYGGVVTSGPRANGGWAVEATLVHEPPTTIGKDEP